MFVHRDCRMSVRPGEFVASKTHKQDFEQDGVWQELLYQAVASRDGQHIGRLRTWIDDGFVGGVALPANDGFGGAILDCRENGQRMRGLATGAYTEHIERHGTTVGTHA